MHHLFQRLRCFLAGHPAYQYGPNATGIWWPAYQRCTRCHAYRYPILRDRFGAPPCR